MSGSIPGFTEDQTWALKALIQDAVREANDHDRRVDKLEECVFGNGKGLKEKVNTLESEVNQLVWASRAVIVAALGVIATALAGVV